MFSRSIVKYIQSLQHKKFRDQHGAFIAEGPKVVTELILGNQFECNHIYALENWIVNNSDLLSHCHNKVSVVKEFELEKLALFNTPNAVVAEFKMKAPVQELQLDNKISLVLDDIRDPGNFGTIIRIADWFGVQNILCSVETVDMYNPKVVQSTMASLGRVNILYADLQEMLRRNSHIRSYAAVLEGKPLQEIKHFQEGFIIIGNESNGISKALIDLASEKITINKMGYAESLNAAVATGIILFFVTQ